MKKFVQIAVVATPSTDEDEADHCLYALDEAGNIWALNGDEWERVPGRSSQEIDS
jgi:hypothetical protein